MMQDGFATVRRTWKNGDTIELHLPMQIRRAVASAKVAADHGRVVIERGPLVCAWRERQRRQGLGPRTAHFLLANGSPISG